MAEIRHDSGRSLLPRGYDASLLGHQDNRTDRGPWAVSHPSRDNKCLAGAQLDGPPFEVNEPLPFDHIEELVGVGVLVPVILPLADSEANPGVIHLT